MRNQRPKSPERKLKAMLYKSQTFRLIPTSIIILGQGLPRTIDKPEEQSDVFIL
jgi:hypothetical protein